MTAYQSNFPAFSLGPGDSVYLFGIPNTVAAITTVASGGAARMAGITTIKTSAAHNFVPGQQVDIKGVGSVGGFNVPYGFDGSYTILTVPTTTTFTYFDPQKPNDTGGGGNAVSVAAEQPAVLPASGAQVNILQSRGGPIAANVRFEGWWTGAPGAFEIDLQSATSDVDSAYIMNTVSTATKVTADAADTNTTLNQFTVDLSPAPGMFMRPRIITRTNGVGLVLKATGVA